MDERLTALVDNILAGNTDAATPLFSEIMDDRASAVIDGMKADVAASIFSAPATETTEN
jgi:hypothetical protein